MLFQTHEFLALFLIVLVGVTIVRQVRRQQCFLLAMSYLFYGFWDVRFLVLLALSSLVDYTAALGIHGIRLPLWTRVRGALLWLAGAVVTLGFDWRAVDTSGLVWLGLELPLLICALFATLGPLLYEGYFRLAEQQRRRAFLATSIAVNLGLLGFFKYFDFFRDNLVGASRLFGVSSDIPELDVILPVGISFYTFQTLSYTIEVYRGRCTPERDPLRVAFFAGYFPQLVAGPILRPGQFLPRLQAAWQLSSEHLRSGCNLVLVGLCKKVLIADHIAPLASALLEQPTGRPGLMIGFGAALFAVQIYCDFSGYTDIARGVSRMLGVEIPRNFHFPYFSRSLTDFWRRWHISLSTWFRDYVYIPLGGNRVGAGRTACNLMATMALAGLWHGAGWNFLIWGVYHGALLGCERLARSAFRRSARLTRVTKSLLGQWLGWLLTLYLTLLGWLLFRITDLDHLWTAVSALVTLDGGFELATWGLGHAAPVSATLAFCLFSVAHIVGYRWHCWPELLDSLSARTLACVYFLAGFVLFFGWPDGAVPFLYFQF